MYSGGHGCLVDYELETTCLGLVPNATSSNKYKRVLGPEPSVKSLDLGMKAARNVGVNPSAGEVALKSFEIVKADTRTRGGVTCFS